MDRGNIKYITILTSAFHDSTISVYRGPWLSWTPQLSIFVWYAASKNWDQTWAHTINCVKFDTTTEKQGLWTTLPYCPLGYSCTTRNIWPSSSNNTSRHTHCPVTVVLSLNAFLHLSSIIIRLITWNWSIDPSQHGRTITQLGKKHPTMIVEYTVQLSPDVKVWWDNHPDWTNYYKILTH